MYYDDEPPRGHYWIGLDVGQARDYSALAILQKAGKRYEIKYLERLPLDTAYPKQIEHVFQLMHRKPLDKANKVLAIDYTGVGRPVVDLAQDRGLNPVGIAISGGNSVNWSDERNRATVPKRDLVSLNADFCTKRPPKDCQRSPGRANPGG